MTAETGATGATGSSRPIPLYLTWDDHQQWERDWWGNCANTFGEEAKQLTYAHRMGLVNEPRDGRWPVYDLGHRSVLDIGGGPCSILLKSEGPGRRVVLDPCPYPDWVGDRYNVAGITKLLLAAEDYDIRLGPVYDEVWIYNVLQHTRDPELIVANARSAGEVVRIFEWIDTPTAPGHPHTLTADGLLDWFGVGSDVLVPDARRAARPGESFAVEQFTGENGCVGRAFYGVFPQ